MSESIAQDHMGQLADLLGETLRELAQSDARRLRAIEQALKEAREATKPTDTEPPS